MSYLRQFETLTEIASITGLLYGKQAYAFNITGRRAGFTSTTVLNDIKEYDNSVAESPDLSNSTLDIISSNAADTNTAGTGVREVRVVYINNLNNLVESANIALNGTTPVTSVLTGVNDVLWMEAVTVGSGGRAAGNIRLRINGGVVEVEQISIQNNKSFTPRFMVPTGYKAFVSSWRTHAINNDQNVRLQATVHTLDRTVSTVYTAQANSNVAVNTNGTLLLLPFLEFPALCKIKISTISAGTALAVQCDVSFTVILIQD